MSDEPIHRLRAVDLTPIKLNEQDLYLLRDPHGLADEPVVLSPASAYLLQFFDGRHSVADIQLALTRASGQIVPREQLDGFVHKLDEALFLDSPRFASHQEAYAQAYAALPNRPARFAGSAYAKDAGAVLQELDALYALPDGPGEAGQPEPSARMPRALAAPHIDIARGGAAYAHAYRPVWGARLRRIVLLGVCHAPARNPFVLTVKDYATPLGVMPTDRDFIGRLIDRMEWNPLEQQELHRAEHSIEFQVLLLQHALSQGGRTGTDAQVVPILVGLSWTDFYETESGELGVDGRVADFLERLQALLAAEQGDSLVVAGIDLAHVGARFGHAGGLDPARLAEYERRDRATLEQIAAGQRDAFVRATLAEQDDRHICGFGALYSLLTLLPDIRGTLLAYDQAVDPDQSSAVSFAALRFDETDPSDAN